MATPTIPNGKDYFNPILYTGTGAEHAVTGVGFQPDNVVIKRRDTTSDWGNWDSSRGVTKNLKWNKSDAESTEVQSLKTFGTDGFTLGTGGDYNGSGGTFVAYNWLANGGTTATNNNGSQTSTTQANTTAGFSIVTYAGTSSGTATIGHGLSLTPEWIIIKNLTDARNWFVYHKGLTSASYYVSLNSTSAQSTSDVFNNTAPTSAVFSIQDAGSLNTNGSGKNYVAYCWHGVEGFSKFGSYTGNGNADGPFVYTGFKPAFLMIKSYSNAVSWYMFDNKRNPINPAGKRLVADGTYAEDAGTTEAFDFLSNGFKLRNSSTGTNGSGYNMIYMAFAEHPFVGDGTNPVTAR